MRKALVTTALVLLALPLPASAMDQSVKPDALKWGAAPPAFPPGAQFAVIAGDPGKEGPFVLRLKVPASYKVAPHTHPGDENVTVISGSFNIGMGDKLDTSKGEKVPVGGFMRVEKGMQHYAWFTEPTVIQVHGIGPSAINYVNPADDPRKSTKAQGN